MKMATLATTGLVVATKLLNGTDSVADFKHMAIGTDNTGESAAHTALQAETSATGLGRAAATYSYEETNKAKWVHEFTNGSGGTVGIYEMGIFNDASAGTMLLRHVYGAVQNIEDSGSAEFTAIVTLSAS
jgi:hypothetical protein